MPGVYTYCTTVSVPPKNEVDVSDVPPTKHVIDLANVSREDVPRPSLRPEEALANAPESMHDYFVVPKVLPD